MFRGFFISLLLILSLPVMAVETIIVGEIVDEVTGEAIPNVNIHFRGTKIGTTSDEHGNYMLRVDMSAKSQLVFSAVGYYTQRFDVEPGVMAGLQVAMREKTATLTEIVVAPNENLALAILRQVREHRDANDRTQHPENGMVAQREQTLYVSHITRRHLRRALWKSLQAGMIAQEDSTYILPLYRETQSFRLAGQEMIPANDQRTQALILSETDYSALLGGEGNLNFYAPSVSLMGHAFLSPLAAGGNLYYRYYIDEQSVISDQSSAVRITFRTRNPFYATFNGEMIIDTTTYALRALKAYVPPEVAVNYVNDIHVSQTLTPDGFIAEETISALLDFTVKSEKAGSVFPSVLLTTSLKNDAAKLPNDTSQDSSNDEPKALNDDADSVFAALDFCGAGQSADYARGEVLRDDCYDGIYSDGHTGRYRSCRGDPAGQPARDGACRFAVPHERETIEGRVVRGIGGVRVQRPLVQRYGARVREPADGKEEHPAV